MEVTLAEVCFNKVGVGHIRFSPKRRKLSGKEGAVSQHQENSVGHLSRPPKFDLIPHLHENATQIISLSVGAFKLAFSKIKELVTLGVALSDGAAFERTSGSVAPINGRQTVVNRVGRLRCGGDHTKHQGGGQSSLSNFSHGTVGILCRRERRALREGGSRLLRHKGRGRRDR